jgi:hypothetical protein
MSNKKIAVATLILMLVSFVPAFPQAEINPDHFPDPSDAQVETVQSDREQAVDVNAARLAAQESVVEEARQEAISAGIQGDGAASYLDAYDDQVTQLEMMRAKLHLPSASGHVLASK